MPNKIYQYYVEGENEAKIINTLKSELRCIQPGKVTVFDVVQHRITKNRLMRLRQDTVVVLVFDTDRDSSLILRENISFIRKQSNIKTVLCITQVRNLEDELVRSCDIRTVMELTGSKSLADFKHDLNKEKNLGAKLTKASFDISKFYIREPYGEFSGIINNSESIKIKH